MKNKIEIIKKVCIIDYFKIILEVLKEEKLVLSKLIENFSYKDFLKVVLEYMDYCNEYKLILGYFISLMINRNNIFKGVFDNYFYIYIKLEINSKIKFIFIRLKGLYVVVYY